MSIVVKLDDLLHDRRMTLTELSEKVGITLANLSILKTGKARAIRFSTLEAICEALQCQPGDLLEFASTAGATKVVMRLAMTALLYDLARTGEQERSRALRARSIHACPRNSQRGSAWAPRSSCSRSPTGSPAVQARLAAIPHPPRAVAHRRDAPEAARRHARGPMRRWWRW